MTTEDDKSRVFRPPNAPRCDCFDFDDNLLFALGRVAEAGRIANHVAMALVQLARESEFCHEALPFIVDTLNVVLAVHVGTRGTIIELGTVEAENETVRVLTGMEARLLSMVHATYAESYRVGLTEAKVRAWREGGELQ